MPNGWIKRTIQAVLTDAASQLRLFPVWLILGPRQIGKSSTLLRCSTSDRQYVNLDDLQIRTRATQDPQLFFSGLKAPLLIDEIQYAPQLLSPIKQLADSGAAAGSIWLTGSQNFEVMAGVHESLAGRLGILNLFGLSDEEAGLAPQATPAQYFERIVRSTFPKLSDVTDLPARQLYLSSYLQTYIERDVRELLGIQKRREFEIFLKVCALRTGQVINFDAMARDVGVSSVTIKEWLSLLEDSFLIKLVQPHFTNRSKRLIKSPKLYFIDMGLAAFLAGWHDPEMLRLGPMGGVAFETHIFGNILRYFRHRALEAEISFWRTRDGQEIDFIVEAGGKVYPIEVKQGFPSAQALPSLEPLRAANWAGGSVLSLVGPSADSEAPVALSKEWSLRGPGALSEIFI
ncbi:MAG: ATP-binding protein [Oligoflexia bacterium]|nr:ATP-binding protein [Oligoflexia bacterium]